MRKFIIQIFIFITLVFIAMYFVFLQADGYTDPYYLRFTSKKQSSLIIGTSRSAQGLIPQVINQKTNANFLNYSFTVASSPYGPSYFNSIEKKLDKKSTNGIFILAVDPWSISEDKNKTSPLIVESIPMLEEMNFVNMSPNIEYLIKCYNKKRYNILYKKTHNKMLLHKDGWLEVTVPVDSASINKRLRSKIKSYKEICESKSFSKERYKYLEKTINLLNKHGQVFLVRLPIHPDMMAIENKLMPDFNKKIQLLKSKNNGYLDLTPYNSDYIYTDGNHLYKNSGKIVSKKVAEWMMIKLS